jgi:RNA polymerase sigma-70 factor (ECF subfamily)
MRAMLEGKDIEREDRDLIHRMADKDAVALDAFYSRYNRLAFSLILRIVGSREDAEDVLLDVFWQAWQQAGRYDATRGKPIAWLLTIARTRAIDSIRASGRKHTIQETQEHTQDAPQAPRKDDPFVSADTRRAVRDALSTLPENQRTLLEMAYFDGMTHTEIASALKQPLGTVKDRIRNGMLHLRKHLKAYL